MAWLDAAPLLSRVQEALAPGQMVHDDSFSLFESMSAIEIGVIMFCSPLLGMFARLSQKLASPR